MSLNPTWDPDRYLHFANLRLRPALDLLARVPDGDPGAVYDLGCGTGNVTRLLQRRWPEARVVGLDSSPEMLTKAAQVPSTITWTQADLGRWSPPERADLLFSNAALHWLPDHDELLPRLFDQLAGGGVLAVQMPQSWPLPSHRLMREVLDAGGPGGAPLGDPALRASLARRPVLEAGVYLSLLASRALALDVWETTYLQVLEGEDPVLRWVEGTGLRPVLERLGEVDRGRFLEVYRRELAAAYPADGAGRVVYPFTRVFIVATRR